MYTKNSTLSQLITVTGPKSQVGILFQWMCNLSMSVRFVLIKNKTASSGIPEAARHRSDLDIIDLNTHAPQDFLVFRLFGVFGRIRYGEMLISKHLFFVQLYSAGLA